VITPNLQAVSVSKRSALTASSSPTGFTLIEVLVVVSILVLLLAILLPSLSQARLQTKHVHCQANLKQIATGWHMYLDDNNGHFPKSKASIENIYLNFGGKQGQKVRDGQDDNEPYRGPKRLNPYLGIPLRTEPMEGAAVFRCPLDQGTDSYRPSCYEYIGNSYQTNHLLVGPERISFSPFDPCRDVMRDLRDRVSTLTMNQVDSWSRVLLMADHGWYDDSRAPMSLNDIPNDWHGKPNTHNLAFVDGHVSLLRVRRGLLTTKDYTVVPFTDLQRASAECQEECTGDDP